MQTTTVLQRKKSSYQKNNSKKNDEIISKITSGAWWPFDRVDGKLLERLHKQSKYINEQEAPI